MQDRNTTCSGAAPCCLGSCTLGIQACRHEEGKERANVTTDGGGQKVQMAVQKVLCRGGARPQVLNMEGDVSTRGSGGRAEGALHACAAATHYPQPEANVLPVRHAGASVPRSQVLVTCSEFSQTSATSCATHTTCMQHGQASQLSPTKMSKRRTASNQMSLKTTPETTQPSLSPASDQAPYNIHGTGTQQYSSSPQPCRGASRLHFCIRSTGQGQQPTQHNAPSRLPCKVWRLMNISTIFPPTKVY